MPTRPPPLRPLDAKARAASIAETFADGRVRQPVWLFAYGSLLWDPCFSFAERCTAMLDGYRRAFNFWSMRARGTPDRPGLGLGLEAGGSCPGVAYRLAEDTRDENLDAIWAREMYSAVYVPQWLPLQTPQGPVTALCFVTDPAHPQYAGALDTTRTAQIIALATGRFGSCRDYLAETVAALARQGIAEPTLTALLALVDDIGPPANDAAP